MFNAVLIQSVREGEMLTEAIANGSDAQPQHLLVRQCWDVARQFLEDAEAVASLTERVLLFGPLSTDRSGDRW